MTIKESAELLVLVKRFISQFVGRTIRHILIYVSRSVKEFKSNTKDSANNLVCVLLFISQSVDPITKITLTLVRLSVKGFLYNTKGSASRSVTVLILFKRSVVLMIKSIRIFVSCNVMVSILRIMGLVKYVLVREYTDQCVGMINRLTLMSVRLSVRELNLFIRGLVFN